VQANVAPPFIPALKAMLSGKVEIKSDGAIRSAVVEGKPLGEFVKTWSQGDEGKHYVSATQNSGSGAQGARQQQNAAAKTMKRADYDASLASDPAAARAFFKDGGQLVD